MVSPLPAPVLPHLAISRACSWCSFSRRSWDCLEPGKYSALARWELTSLSVPACQGRGEEERGRGETSTSGVGQRKPFALSLQRLSPSPGRQNSTQVFSNSGLFPSSRVVLSLDRTETLSRCGQGLVDLWPGGNLLGISSCAELGDYCSEMQSCGLMPSIPPAWWRSAQGNKLLLEELPASLSSLFLAFVLPFSVCFT